VAEDKYDMWPNQMVTHVKGDVAHKDCESHESRCHVAHILWVHMNLGDVSIPHHSRTTTSRDIHLILPTKIPEAPKAEVVD
jgi:hypothetical protein